MKQDYTSNGKSREEILESILEETARNPYKPGAARRTTSARTAPRSSQAAARQPQASRPASHEKSGAQQAAPQTYQKSQETGERIKSQGPESYAAQDKAAPETRAEAPADVNKKRTQVFEKPAGNRPAGQQANVDMTRIMKREDISEAAYEQSKNFGPESAEDKIRRIQK